MKIFDHRGWPSVFPEETMEAYRSSVACGAEYVEVDVHSLRDGTLVVMHDETVDRITTSTGPVSGFSSPGWAQLTVDAGTFLKGGWGNFRAPLFEDVLREFGNRVYMLIEVKDAGAAEGVMMALGRYDIRKDMVQVNSFTPSFLRQYVLAGYNTSYNVATYSGTPAPAELKAAGYNWVTTSISTSNSNLDALRAAGLQVAVYTVDTHHGVSLLDGHADAVYTDDGAYLRKSAITKTDPFANQTWYHGHLPSSAPGRGYFAAPNKWGIDMSGANTWAGCLWGWASPIGGKTYVPKVTINFSVEYVAAFAEDRFSWIALFDSDKPFPNDLTPVIFNGYTFVCRKNGTINVYRYTDGVEAAHLIATGSGSAIPNGGTANFRISITPGSVSLERLSDPGSTAATANDTTHRGAYMHAGVKGVHGIFSSVILS